MDLAQSDLINIVTVDDAPSRGQPISSCKSTSMSRSAVTK